MSNGWIDENFVRVVEVTKEVNSLWLVQKLLNIQVRLKDSLEFVAVFEAEPGVRKTLGCCSDRLWLNVEML